MGQSLIQVTWSNDIVMNKNWKTKIVESGQLIDSWIDSLPRPWIIESDHEPGLWTKEVHHCGGQEMIKIEDWNNGQDCGVGRGWFRAWIGLLINKCLTSNQHWLEKYKRKTFTCTLNRPFLFLFWFWLYFKVLILSLPVRPTIFWLQIFKFGEHFMGKKIILIIRDQNK